MTNMLNALSGLTARPHWSWQAGEPLNSFGSHLWSFTISPMHSFFELSSAYRQSWTTDTQSSQLREKALHNTPGTACLAPRLCDHCCHRYQDYSWAHTLGFGESDESRDHSLLARRYARRREGGRSALRDVSAGRHFYPRLRAGNDFENHPATQDRPNLYNIVATR